MKVHTCLCRGYRSFPKWAIWGDSETSIKKGCQKWVGDGKVLRKNYSKKNLKRVEKCKYYRNSEKILLH